MTDWRPMESAPKDGTRILGYGPGVEGMTWPTEKPMPLLMGVVFWWTYEYDGDEDAGNGLFRKVKLTGGNCWKSDGLSWFNPTHWMPLPDPPQ